MKTKKDLIQPAFCPNELCRMHEPETAVKSGKWFFLGGTYERKSSGIRIQRYVCRECRRHFSSSTFSVHYYAKKRLNLRQLLLMLCSGASLRGIGRVLGCKCDTIGRKIDILSRQSVAVHSILKKALVLKEDIACDGFESFSVSQYFPNNFNITVGSDSRFVYYFNYVQLRRKGNMTAYQKEKAERLKEDWPLQSDRVRSAITEKLIDLYNLIEKNPSGGMTSLFTDEHHAYKKELAMEYRSVSTGEPYRIKHLTVSSRKRRDRHNPLFPVNYMDREFRKDLAEHRRESTCFSRNVSSSTARMSAYILYHNCMKPYLVKSKANERLTHAEKAGIPEKMLKDIMNRVFEARFFLSHLQLDKWKVMVWLKAYPTPNRRIASYVPMYALA